MKLRHYLAQENLTASAFAERIGTSAQAIYRYMEGDRMPKPRVLAKIVEATKGHVQPNDFYPPHQLPDADALPVENAPKPKPLSPAMANADDRAAA